PGPPGLTAVPLSGVLGGSAAESSSPAESLSPSSSPLFAFKIGEKDGFIILSADERAADVLAYSTTGSLESIPDNMRAWFAGYQDQLRYLATQPATAAGPRRTEGEITAKNPISPLLTTMWNQKEPYNLKCPTFINGERCVTGCVATAMAQVMYYHQWPDSTIAEIPSYISSPSYNGGIAMDSIPAGLHFDWENMTEIYQGDESEEQIEAISTLMLAAGASVRMNYRDFLNGGSSSALYDVPYALKTYFDYSPALHYEYRAHYTADVWEQMVYDELKAGRPVLYQGSSSGGTHDFVVDGYSEGFFHINWGWGNDNSEVYCRLTVLNPGNNSGAGASSTLDGYSSDQSAVFGIKKNEGEEPHQDYCLTAVNINVEGAYVRCNFENNTGVAELFSYGIGTIDEDGKITPIQVARMEFSTTSVIVNSTFRVSRLDPGTYRVIPISKLASANKWNTNVNPETEYIEAVVTEEDVTLTVHKPVVDLAAQIEVLGSHLVGERHTVRVTITNNGSEFYGKIYLLINHEGEAPKLLHSAGITVRAGAEVVTDFSYVTNKPDTVFFSVATDNTVDAPILATRRAAFNYPPANPLDTDAIDLQATLVFEPLSADGVYILGTKPRVKITITNPTDSNYVGSLKIRQYRTFEGNTYKKTFPGTNTARAYTIKNHSVDEFYLDERFPDAATGFGAYQMGHAYNYKVYFRKNGYFTEPLPPAGKTIVPPVFMYRADGFSLAEMSRDTCVVPTRAAAVDLKLATETKFVKGGNPNTIYFIGENMEVPEGITRNIVRGGQADTILLADGYNFYIPEDIKANHIRYTRTFRRGFKAATQDGWNTMTLPFAVNKVEVTEDETTRPIEWLRPGSDRQDFWLMQFDHQDGNNLVFKPVGDFTANQPYLVAVPQSPDDIGPDLTGKPVSFMADNVTLLANAPSATTGINYQMNGIRYFQELDSIFALNTTGAQFELVDTTIQAFRAYFSIRRTSNTSVLGIMIDAEMDGISAPDIHDSDAAERHIWYNLSGQPVGTPNRKGFFLRKGQKYVRK
ncbi:MAG: C10 family peptidase, partial [Bacteroidaceae bacterium]|nr:C10 family peptidase [Bacteroidaceae bacterium]